MPPFFPLVDPAVVCVCLLNPLLRSQDWARAKLARHAGKTVRLAAAGRSVNLAFTPDGLARTAGDAAPDVTLSLPADRLGRLPAILLERIPRASPQDAPAGTGSLATAGREAEQLDALTGLTHIEGDAALAQVVAELARSLRWDVQDELARRVGDVAAVRLTRGASALAVGAQRSAARLADNLGEYLAHESGQVLARPPFEDWRGDVHGLQQRLSQLEARLQRLESAPRRPGRS